MATVETNIERAVAALQEEMTEVRGVLGIRYKGDTGLVSDVELIKEDRIAWRYERKQANALLYTSVFLHVVEVVMIVGLLMQL
jgi:hypothetical protein